MNQKIAQKILEQTKVGYDQIAEHFSVTRIWPWKVTESFFSYLKSGDKVLDIGCGNGRLFGVLQNKSVKYIGTDNNEKLIEIARCKFEIRSTKSETNSNIKIQNSKPEFLVMDALNLCFQEGEFSHIFMMAVLPHVPSHDLQLRTLENACRVLKPGGYLFIICWNLWQPKIFLQNLKSRIKNRKNYQGLGWQDFLITWKNSQREILSQRFYHAFTKKELKRLLEEAGFKIEKIFYEYKGEKSNWLKGFNLVAIARKI